MLYPQVIPFVFETGEIRLRAWYILEMYKALSDGVSRDGREYLLQGAPVQARRATTSRLDDGGRIPHKLVVIPVPEETMPSGCLNVSLT